MGIFKRLHDIVAANLDHMIDAWEDPKLMLSAAVREMDEAIAVATRETARAIADEKLTRRDLEEHRAQVHAWQSRAENAVRAGDDPAARRALLCRQDYAKMAAALEDQARLAGEAAGVLRRQLDAMIAKRAEARRRLGTLQARLSAARLPGVASRERAFDQGPFEKFEKLRAKVDQVEAEADALRELQRCDCTDPDTPDVEAELATLKAALERSPLSPPGERGRG